ncbi:Polyketide synthase PksJ [Leucoagaricus sp. SymC.cos]|nr:Polyketide synthase PksJ [Leucoagaricus sp. SymC.cos]
MLTSGSTGNSKAVVLPHTILLSAVKGKALKHETKDTDIFLNWINFDHVANVTEAHLHAVWSGASQYQVEPSVIIRKPRNLLDWCSRFHVTHTFSPNFLLAQIYRDMSSALSTTDGMLDLSSLRVFVTGGEANPVKTAAEFSDLLERFGAPRTTLRAAFGMTETAAGSIYNNSPVLRNISEYDGSAFLSVGTPAVGLRMRTVDPLTGFSCPSNVVGQLQVSGTSVFSHYYANSDATHESFTSDGWFVTGDLATIDDHGYLHILGRHKDVINVNGVKHPSVDVEHYIEDSKIRGVENSLVFVSALRLEGADTETYAVFYQHADVFTEEPNALTEGEVKALLATNRGIRNVCGVFCSQAPHAILPLPRKYCVKTALGKVSRSGLTKVYEQGAFAALERFLIEAASIPMRRADEHASAHSHSAFDEVVCEGVAEVFGLDPLTLDLNQNLFDIGASSMHLVRLKTFLQDRFHIHEVPTIELLKRPIISQLSTYIQELRACGKNYQASYNPLICFNLHGSKPPLYLVHPGVGEVLIFINLARILNDDRPIYALRARGFEAGETPPTSMQEMIEIYTDAIERNNRPGPYFLAGYSFGAAVAVEIGKLLEERGKTVAWVGVLNLPPFIQFRVQELTWVETMMNLCMFLALVTSENLDNFKSRLLAANPGGDTDAEPPNSRQLVEWTYAHCDRARLGELHLNVEDFHRWTNVAYDVSFTGRSYVPSGAVNGALTTVFCAIPLPSMGTKEEYKHDRLSKWKDYSGRHFEMIDVDGEHYTMISEEHVESFAPKMKAAIHRAEVLLAFSPSAPAPKLNFDAVPTTDFLLEKSDPDEYFKQLKFAC